MSAVRRPIRFRRLASVLHNDFRLGGRGEIEIDDEKIVVRGLKRKGLRRVAAACEFAAGDVIDVTSYGRMIWFMTPDAGGRLRRMVVYADNEADAQAIFDALPRRLSPGKARERAEEDDFLDRLHAITPRAWVTRTLITANVLAFLAMAIDGGGFLTGDPAVLIEWGSNYAPLTATGEWWRLFTCIFLHAGVIHLALNMWALFDAGRVAERLYGNFRFFVVYVFSGLSASVASIAWNPHVNSAGASGAVFGVLGALLVYLLEPANRVPATVVREHRFVLLAFIGYSLVFGFANAHIDNAAHIGGLVGGALAGWALARPLEAEARKHPSVRRPLVAGVVLVAALMAAGSVALGRAHDLHEEARLQQLLAIISNQERELNVATEQTLQAIRLGHLAQREAAERLEALAARWRANADELNELRLSPRSRHANLKTLVARYVALRAETLTLLSASVREGDQAKARLAGEYALESRRLEASIRREAYWLGRERQR